MSEDKLPTVPEWHDIVMRCDGECHSRGECVGEVKTYEIVQSTSSTRWNGLRFNYCETAFLHDCDNGFVLNSVEDAVSPHNANVQPVAAVDIDLEAAEPRAGCNILLGRDHG